MKIFAHKNTIVHHVNWLHFESLYKTNFFTEVVVTKKSKVNATLQMCIAIGEKTITYTTTISIGRLKDIQNFLKK